jgi:polynucleotide 5'-kinase involved in rRNA processing
LKLIELRPSSAVVRRDVHTRRLHRARQFASYFAQAEILELDWSRMAVFPYPAFRMHRLVSFEDRQGLSLAVGIVVSIDRTVRRIRLLAPLGSLAGVNAVRLGDLLVSPDTFHDEQIMS